MDFGLTGPAFTSPFSALRFILPPVPVAGGLEAPSYPGRKVRSARSDSSSGEVGTPSEELQNFLWQQFFSDPSQWSDNRRRKPTLRHPDFSHKKSKIVLWLDNRHKPAWVDSQLASWDAGMKRAPAILCTSVQRQLPSGTLRTQDGNLGDRMCRKLCEDGRITDAVDALNLMVQQGYQVSNGLLYLVLKSCIPRKDLVLVRRMHSVTVKSGYEGNAFLATHFICLYASCGKLDEAMQVFTKVPVPSAYNWATIILAHARHGEAAQAIRLYRQMLESTVKPNNHIYVAVLKACASAGDLVTGKEVHARILASPREPDIFLQTGLVNMYAKCGSLEDAHGVFDKLPQRDVVTWNALIAGYAQQAMGQETLTLYGLMQSEGIAAPDSFTFASLLQACASVGVGALHQGKQIHAQMGERGMQTDVVLGGSLVNMYAKCGSLEDARRVFECLRGRDVVTWTAMIAGYAQQGMGQEALHFYNRMQLEGITPNTVTIVCLLQACASVGERALHQGKQLHASIQKQGLQSDLVVGGSLVNMYAKCGSLEEARGVFDGLQDKNVVTWNTMLAGYVQQGMGKDALTLYSSMQKEGMKPPDSVTFLCLLQACAIVAALPIGKRLHAQIKERGLQADVVVGAALVNMYAKCGSMFDAQLVFDSLPERTIEVWGALTGGYTRHGDSDAVFGLVDRMSVEGIQPDGITFHCVLAVCSHVGLVDKGREYFESMRADYGIIPTADHYTCMMDLLGRAGHLDEALQMAKSMPFSPDGAVWRTLLGACQKWSNVEIGREAFDLAISADQKDAASYVLMSNIYARAQMWEEAKEMRRRRLIYGAWKQPGQSWWTDMSGVVHTFVVGNKKHVETESIVATLEKLVPSMKKAGYVPHLASSSHDIPDDEKEAELRGHSERLAIAYALNRSPEGATIRVVKNLRVCVDRHTAIGYIS